MTGMRTGLPEAGGPVVRFRVLRPGSDAPGHADGGIRNAGRRQCGAARGGVALEVLGDSQCAGGRLNILSVIDNACTGIGNQRPNQVSDDFYAHSLTTYFNRAAFAQPAPGTLGDLPRNAVIGPNYWAVDLAMSKLIAVTGTQRLELRIEAFNLFNWGDPQVNFSAGTFGRITTQAGAPRIMQFGIKYDL